MLPVPDGAVAAARHAYVAHHFEPGLIGFHEMAHVYDLIGAYSWALTTIPCMAHGEWVSEQDMAIGPIPQRWPTMRLVEWHVPASRRRPWGPFPWRYGDGAICYPLNGAAWVWHPEYEAALAIWGPAPFRVHDAWSFVPGCDHRPWDAITELLPKRQQFPALKKMLNSIPGKLAQSRPHPGPWFDPVTAGLVTAMVRARMLEALAAAGSHAIGCVADALWTTKEIDTIRRIGVFFKDDEPGSWRHSTHKGVLFVQPGLSFGDPNEQHPWGLGLASQGTPAIALNDLAGPFHEAWAFAGLQAALEVEYKHFVGITEAVAANLPGVGYRTDAKHWVRFSPLRKRDTERSRAIESGGSYHMTTEPPHAPDPDYFYLTGEPPAKIGDAWMSAPYWSKRWETVSTPIDDLWPTEADELVP